MTEDFADKCVGFGANIGRKIMFRVRVFGDKEVWDLIKGVDGRSRADAVADAGDLEVGVAPRRINENGPGGEGAEYFGKVEGHLGGVLLVNRGNAGHVAVVAPSGEVAVLIFWEGVETAARYQDLDARVENAYKQCIVPAQGVADAADAFGIGLRQLFK